MLTGHVTRQRRLDKIKDKKALEFRSFHIKKGDTVQVISGKDKGRTGRVLQVVPEKERVMVERVNLIKRHQRPSQRLQKGGIIEKENPMHVSNVMLVCTKCKEPTRARRDTVDGKKVRICKKCDEQIDQG